NSLANDFEFFKDDGELKLIQGAIRLSAHVLSRDSGQLAGQLIGRLRPGSGNAVDGLLERAARSRRRSWLRPLRPGWTAPGGPLLRTLLTESSRMAPVLLTEDAKTAICVSKDGLIQEWNLESGAAGRSILPRVNWPRDLAMGPNGTVLAAVEDQ